MKKSTCLAAIALALAIILTSAATAPQKSQSAEVLLGTALHQEEVEGNLEAAIQTYKKLLADYPENRPLAAKALLQMGRCYEKLGKEGARNAYERLVRDYADQNEAAAQARARLAALRKPPVAGKEPALATRKIWTLPDIGNIEGAPSPDGRYLSFTDWDTGDLAIRDLEAGTNRRLTDKGPWEKSEEFAMFSRWSPDGKMIAYDWYDGNNMDMRVISLEGGDPRTLLDNGNGEWLQTYDWSPDSKQILIFLEKKDGQRQIVLVSASDGTIKVIKTFERPGRSPQTMRYSNDGRYIAFDQPQEENTAEYDIFLISVDGGHELPLVKHPAQDFLLGWPPNGEGILFASDRSGALDMWFLRVSGGEAQGVPEFVKGGVDEIVPLGFTRSGSFYYAQGQTKLDVYVAKMDRQSGKILAPPEKAIKRFEGANSWPEYSPDGRYLAYVSTKSRTFQASLRPNIICIRSLETGKEQEFTTKFNRLAGIRWSPDGRFLYLAAWDDKGMGIYRADTQNGTMTPIVRDEGSQRFHSHSVSVDGKTLIYERRFGEAPKQHFRILSRDLTTGEEKEVYAGKAGNARLIAALSPDGERLAIINLDKKRTLCLIPAKGGEPRDLLTFEDGLSTFTPLEWTADGKHILFLRASSTKDDLRFSLCRISADGGEPQELGLAMANMENMSVHPDGVQMAFSSLGSTRKSPSIWVMENFLPPALARPAARDTSLVIRSVPYVDSNGNPSPDGKHLAYVDWDTANLAVYNVATGVTRLLTKDGSWGEHERYPENLIWSPDSQRIAYTWNMWDLGGAFRTELRVISPDGESPPKTIVSDERYIWPWDWSPDGRRILCGLQVGGPRMDRALINVDTGAVEKLNLPSGSLGSLYQFTPKGDSIFYSRPSDGKWNPDDIYLYDLESGESKTIVEHPAEDLVVGILPGTDWFFFASDRRGSFDLWAIPFREGQTEGQPILIKQGLRRFIPLSFTNKGSFYYVTPANPDDVFLADFDPATQKLLGEPRRLSSRWEGTTMDASFSPDGKSIAYVVYRGSRARSHAADSLVVQSLKEADAYPIVVDFSELHLENVSHPSWAANGQSIVVGGRRRGEKGYTRSLIRVDLPGLRKTEIYGPSEGGGPGGPRCTRTSDSVYFVLRRAQSLDTVMQTDLDGRSEKEIYHAPEGQFIKGIALSPDDKNLSIVTAPSLTSPSRCTLLLLSLDGSPPRRIHEFMDYIGGAVGQAWTPDGKAIFYTVKDKLDERGWSIQRIPVDGGGASETVFRHDNPTFGMAFHPNGRMIAFTGRVGSSNTSDAWVMENLKEELKRLASNTEKR